MNEGQDKVALIYALLRVLEITTNNDLISITLTKLTELVKSV